MILYFVFELFVMGIYEKNTIHDKFVIVYMTWCAGASGHSPSAAPGARLHGVDGAAGLHAGLVVGRLHAPPRRLPGLPQERSAPACGLAAGGRRLHLAHAAQGPQHASVGLYDYY